jgi:tetratricopeptide (TPR) repeat protein
MTERNMDAARKLNAEAQELVAKGEVEAALDKYGEVLDLLPQDETEASARVLNNMGHANVRIKNFGAAKEAFSEAAEFFRQAGNQLSLGEQLGNIGSVHRDLEEFDEALEIYFEALEIFSRLGDKNGVASQQSNIAYAYARKGELGEAMDYFTKAKALFEEIGDERRSAMCRENIELLAGHLEGKA